MRISCRSFEGHKPCQYHKKNGVECNDECDYYSPIHTKILIIKLDSLGDVLRTTSILQGLKDKYHDPHITWLTRENALDLLKNNPLIDRVLPYNHETLLMLKHEQFSLLINPSNDKESAVIASTLSADEKQGYGFDSIGNLYPFNVEATYWLSMAISDTLKKQNTKTFQDIMLDMLKINHNKKDTLLFLTEKEIKSARTFCDKHNLHDNDFVVGVNTGAGEKWPLKKLSIEKSVTLINRLSTEYGAKVILFGGPQENERNKKIMSLVKVPVIDTGCDNSLLDFASKIHACDILITSDSLALHIGNALAKKVVVFFGPTSPAEIDLYGRGIKIVPQHECVGCYSREHKKDSSCIDHVSVQEILDALRTLK